LAGAAAGVETSAMPALSVVVVAYDMARELPRTLQSLSAAHQLGVAAGDYEVIVVDNGSPVPLDPDFVAGLPANTRVVRIDDARPSPVFAANAGLGMAGGDLIGLLIDGARIASPRLLSTARLAAGIVPRPVITAPAFHLGPVTHKRAAEVGYDQAVEDQLLADVSWPADGDALFGVSTLAGSSGRGIFGPMGESNSLFMPRALWDELGGMDEHFDLPGGGLANHDLFRRACELDGVELVVLLGEATFHQYHGGATTGGRYGWDEMHAQYERIRGYAHRPPQNAPLFVGRVHRAVLPHLEQSARMAINRLDNEARASLRGHARQ
jgi:glycosyltransferase involved in cell wall biosynthesis